MKPSLERIRQAAYARWEHRGMAHGFDRQDWLAAEAQERFFSSYQVIAADQLDGTHGRTLGSATSRRCRFCTGASPRVTFPGFVSVFPTSFGPGSPVALDQCDECVAGFAEEIDSSLTRFVAPHLRRHASDATPVGGIPVTAFKGLVKLGLAVMPLTQLDEYEETIDWLGNPDHDFDLSVLRDLSCVVHLLPSEFPSAWSALAERFDDGEAWPSTLFFLGLNRVVFQVVVPLGRRDDDYEITASHVPPLLPPSPFGLGFDPIARLTLPIVSQRQSARRLEPQLVG